MADKMTVQILADGTMKVTTDAVSMANHLSAEKFLKFASDLLGGKVKNERRKGLKAHTHSHGDDHHHH
tara:strand:- start:1629 stop:1832 length:204 start_codon:yes stop_codon:yes gene_type:complete